MGPSKPLRRNLQQQPPALVPTPQPPQAAGARTEQQTLGTVRAAFGCTATDLLCEYFKVFFVFVFWRRFGNFHPLLADTWFYGLLCSRSSAGGILLVLVFIGRGGFGDKQLEKHDIGIEIGFHSYYRMIVPAAPTTACAATPRTHSRGRGEEGGQSIHTK
jgi:hypothetical protein